jgi:hypothetical protein
MSKEEIIEKARQYGMVYSEELIFEEKDKTVKKDEAQNGLKALPEAEVKKTSK